MNLAVRLLLYIGVTAGLFGGLALGVLWLVQPDPSIPQQPKETRARPVPPRIADSIERKLAPLPVAAPEPLPVRPAMREGNAALVTSVPTVRELSKPAAKKRARKPAREEGAVTADQAPAAYAPVNRGRTDFPF